MIKPKILSDEDIMKAHEGEKCRDCGRSIAQAQNDYTIRQIIEYLKAHNKFPQCKGLVLTVEDWQALQEEE